MCTPAPGRSTCAPMDEPSTFARHTAVHPSGPGRYLAHMDPSWWIIAGPNGGYVAAVVLRAIVTEVDDPARRPRSITLHYLRPPSEGPVEVQVSIERSGRSVSNVSARMHQDGRLLVVAMAALASDRSDSIAFDDAPGLPSGPDGRPVPGPDELPAQELDPDRDVPMRSHYDMRWVLGDLPFRPATGERRAHCGGWLRLADPEPVDEIVLAAFADAWMPPIFCRVDQPLAVPTVDLTVHFRALPSDPLGWCFAEFSSPLAEGGYLVEHGRVLDATGRLLAESRQLAVVA